MRRRNYLALAAGITAGTAAGCLGGDDTGENDTGDGEDGSNETSQSANTDTPTEEPTEDPPEEPEDVEISGNGDTVTETIEIQGGYTQFNVEHDGTGTFTLEADIDGARDVQFSRDIGPARVEVPASLPSGEIQLEIEADGDWEIEITQPRPTEGDLMAVPSSHSSAWPTVLGPFDFDGDTRIHASYDGDSKFLVEVLDLDGHRLERAFDTTGAFEGEAELSTDGAGWVWVATKGNWTVELE